MERIQITRDKKSISKLTRCFCGLKGKKMMPKLVTETFNIR